MKKTDKFQAEAVFPSRTIITSVIIGILLLIFTISGAQAAEFTIFGSVKNLLGWQAPQNRTPIAANLQLQKSDELPRSTRASVMVDAPAILWSNAKNFAWLNIEQEFSLKVLLVPPTLGNYTNTTIALSGNTTITPAAAPTNAATATATTIVAFKGKLEVDPTTGVVRVTNAHPANLRGNRTW